MKEWFRKLRYKLAHLIAPDWIDDLEYRLSGFLCEVTGGRLSKCYYPLEVMIDEYQYCRMRECDECEYYVSSEAEIQGAPTVDAVEVDKAMAWLEGYTMTDTEQIYSNGIVFVPLFRVEQAFVDKAYNGLWES